MISFKTFLLEQPTDAQIKAGNYKKKHVNFNGFDIAIENRKGSVRSGTDPDGTEWSVKLYTDYGYIKKTNGADGDELDVFVGDDKKSERIFIINQLNHKGKFDEHKILFAFSNKNMAENAYLRSYEKGWSHYDKNIIEMSIEDFNEWLKNDDTKKPIKNNQE